MTVLLLLYICQNLTEFNTAHNKRISLLTIEEGNLEIQRPKRKRRNSRVTFSEEDSIINPGKKRIIIAHVEVTSNTLGFYRLISSVCSRNPTANAVFAENKYAQ